MKKEQTLDEILASLPSSGMPAATKDGTDSWVDAMVSSYHDILGDKSTPESTDDDHAIDIQADLYSDALNKETGTKEKMVSKGGSMLGGLLGGPTGAIVGGLAGSTLGGLLSTPSGPGQTIESGSVGAGGTEGYELAISSAKSLQKMAFQGLSTRKSADGEGKRF